MNKTVAFLLIYSSNTRYYTTLQAIMFHIIQYSVYESEEMWQEKFTILCFFFVTVFPNVPAAPGMPCQGEDRKYFYYIYEFLGVTSMLDLCTIFFISLVKKRIIQQNLSSDTIIYKSYLFYPKGKKKSYPNDFWTGEKCGK